MTYLEGNTTKQLVLVEGTVGKQDENYAQLKITNSPEILNGTKDPSQLELTFTNGFLKPKATEKNADGTIKPGTTPYYGASAGTITFSKASLTQFPEKSGSIQASLDMLWQDGKSTQDIKDASGNTIGKVAFNKVNGYDYYMNELDRLAYTFGTVMNTINDYYNNYNGQKDPLNSGLLIGGLTGLSYTNVDGAAKKIQIHSDWLGGGSYVSTKGDNSTDAVMDMLEAMSTVYYTTGSGKNANNFLNDGKTASKYTGKNGIMDADLDNNTFIGFINHVSTVLANDSYTNQYTLKNNVTVLNGIQDSRDNYSGVSLDEEASNMMMYMSAYNAASRLMTTLDEALNTLINSTGLVGR